MSTHITRSPAETEALAAQVLERLAAMEGVRGTSTIVALQGDLGAGKTVFAKGAAQVLGVHEVVTSPTFVIQKVYQLPATAPWKRLVHIDAYRLEGEEELHSIGWDDVATDPGNLVIVEWPLQVGLGIPERALWVEFEQIDEHTRKVTIGDGEEPHPSTLF